jgi:ABC-type phosphate/phosphonate transport system substrate-binding protein
MGALTAVIENKAEVAPLDSYAFALIAKHAPDLAARVRVIKSTEPTAVPAFVASGESPNVTAAFLAAGDDPETRALMDRLLLDRFARPERAAYDDLKKRFLAMQAFWRRHPLAETAHPLFATEFGGN